MLIHEYLLVKQYISESKWLQNRLCDTQPHTDTFFGKLQH